MSDELGRRKRVEGLPEWVRRLMANEEDEMEYNALQRIAALKLCSHCGGTGWEPNSSPPECSVCEGMRVVPALTDRQAQILAQETLALIRMHKEDEGD